PRSPPFPYTTLFRSLRHFVEGMSLQEAIDAPAFHTSSFPVSFYPRTMQPRSLIVEDRLGDSLIGALERRGHVITRSGPWSLDRRSEEHTSDLQSREN